MTGGGGWRRWLAAAVAGGGLALARFGPRNLAPLAVGSERVPVARLAGLKVGISWQARVALHAGLVWVRAMNAVRYEDAMHMRCIHGRARALSHWPTCS